MSTIGVRELRQNASEVLREVEAGDTVTVTAAGRPVAKIVPLLGDQWVSGERIKLIFDSPTDLDWDAERRAFGAEEISDPWNR
jgi:prevent-host-death family protein